MDRTFVMLKPDSVKRKIVGEIITRFEKRNFTITNLKMMNINKDLAFEHYFHVKDKPFFNDMINYITSGPVIAMIISGDRVIEAVRSMIGKTSNFDSQPGTIRGDYGYHPFENMIHASDSPENAETEIKRFFPELDI